MAENSHINWTYEKRLKLESKLLLITHPVLCMDSSPIAGLTINLQHQLLSGRTIELNPIKNKDFSSENKSQNIDLLNNSHDDIKYNSAFTNEESSESSESEVSSVVVLNEFYTLMQCFPTFFVSLPLVDFQKSHAPSPIN